MNNFGISDNVLAFIVASAGKHGVTSVVLFGSRANGTHLPKSDIDLAVTGPGVLDFQADLEENCPTLLMFDIVDCNRKISATLQKNITNEGALIYG